MFYMKAFFVRSVNSYGDKSCGRWALSADLVWILLEKEGAPKIGGGCIKIFLYLKKFKFLKEE